MKGQVIPMKMRRAVLTFAFSVLAISVTVGREPVQAPAEGSAKIWTDRAKELEEYLKSAEVVSVEEIGPGATVGHMCVVHGAVVGAEALIGNGATVQDGARIGERSLIGAGSLVPPGAVIPDDVMALGAPARVRGPLSDAAAGWVHGNPSIYQELARRHAAGIADVSPRGA